MALCVKHVIELTEMFRYSMPFKQLYHYGG